MLFDLFTSLTTRCSPYIRGSGYVDETLAMRRRYRRRAAWWQTHLDNTRRFVLEAAERCRSRNRVIVVGSGLLLDVPLARLSGLFREVVLTDVVCLPEIRKRIQAHGNVTFVEQDAANIAERLYRNKQHGSHELPEVMPASPRNYEGADLVVSLNILSQLWVIPRAYAIQPRPRVAPDQLDAWCRRLVESHYSCLLSLPCSVCLIADYEFVKRDRAGDIISRGSTVYNLALPAPDASWLWNIGPLGEESGFYSKELIVGAWHLR